MASASLSGMTAGIRVMGRGTAVELVSQLLDEFLDVLDIHLRQLGRQSRLIGLARATGTLAERVRIEIGVIGEIGTARGAERERIGRRCRLVRTQIHAGRHRQRFGPDSRLRTVRRRLGAGSHCARRSVERASRQRRFKSLGGRGGLPVGIAVEQFVVVVLGVGERPPHEQVQQQQDAVNGERRQHRRGEFQAKAADQPGAGCERQQRHGEDDERVAEACEQGLGLGQLSCHATDPLKLRFESLG